MLGCDKPTLELLAEMVNGVMMGDEEADQVAIVASKPPAMQLKLVRVLRACSPQAWRGTDAAWAPCRRSAPSIWA